MDKSEINTIFQTEGWNGVWSGLLNQSIPIENVIDIILAAIIDDDNITVSPFWLSGVSSFKKNGTSESQIARIFLNWLRGVADRSDYGNNILSSDVLYLLQNKIINWSMQSDWKNGCKTLAEATIFDIKNENMFEWDWDWSAIQTSWWKYYLEVQPSKFKKAILNLDKCRDSWGDKETKLALATLEVLNKSHNGLNGSIFGKTAKDDSIMFINWEKITLMKNFSHHKEPDSQDQVL